MIRRAITIGTLFGVLISLAGIYPLVGLVAPAVLHNWDGPIRNEVVHGLLLMASAVVVVPCLFLMAPVAVRYTGVHTPWLGAKVGALTGLVATTITFMTLTLPLTALLAFTRLVPVLPTLDQPLPPADVLGAYVTVLERGGILFDASLFVALIIWGSLGAYFGWRWRGQQPTAAPSLFALFSSGEQLRRGIQPNESGDRAAMIVGIALASLVVVSSFNEHYLAFRDWPEMAALLEQSGRNIETESFWLSMPVLLPLVALGFLIFGGVVVWLTNNPHNQFTARIRAVILASHTILMFSGVAVLRLVYFHLGLFPFWMFRWWQANEIVFDDMATDTVQTIQAMALYRDPGGMLITLLVLPWAVLVLVLILGWMLGVVQGAVYGVLVPLLRPQPVDLAARLHHKLRHQPEQILPMIYGLFQRPEGDAYDVLAFLAARTARSMPEVGQLTAALHSQGQPNIEPAVRAGAVNAVHEILLAHDDWRWARDFAVVYGATKAVLAANTLEQILAIDRPPEQQTSSLPPGIVKSIDRVGKVVMELHKVEVVEDLPTKLIFLENSLDALHEAQRFVDKELGKTGGSILPEYRTLDAALDHWQHIVIKAIKRLKGRAFLSSLLSSQQLRFSSPLELPIQVANTGLNVAQQVRVRLLPGYDYRLTEKTEVLLDILAPGEEKQLLLPILPREGVPRLRVEWEVTYDDAVDADRRLSFADVVEFKRSEKPFQRIFPIPYVTGTPLKTDDVFVGREDVFSFIKENLLGAHQNNVIILHGQRRTGKTSVLYRLGRVMADTHYGVLVDMQGKPARDVLDFLYSIADDIVFALEDHGIEVELPPRAEFAEAPEFVFRSRFLRGLNGLLNGKNLLLMFDEFEELQRRVEDGRLQPDIFQFLRNLMQHEKHVDFVFSGTHKLEDLGAQYWSVLFNIAAYKPITFLSHNEMRRLITAPVAGYNVEYDPLALERIVDVTAGHPYFAQLVLHEMVVYHNEIERNYLTVTDVNAVLERIVERGEAHFKYIWSESTTAERSVLQGMTEMLVGRDHVSPKELHEFLTDHGYVEDADSCLAAVRALVSRDILTPTSAGNPRYHFKVDLIRLWIERTRPVVTV